MKLSKFVKRAKSESYCMVIHADDSGIWLGTRSALYNATELPEMEGKEQVGAVLDIDSKAWEKMFFDEKYAETGGAAFGMNLTDADPLEQEARRVPLEMFYKGMGLVGLMFDTEDQVPYNKVGYDVVDSAEMKALNLKVADSIMTLLKNDGTLPLDKSKLHTVGVIGPNADSRKALLGNYEGTASRYTTVLEGIEDYLGDDVKVRYSQGCHLYADNIHGLAESNELLSEVKGVCEESDVVIAVLGLDSGLEGEEGDKGNQFASGDKPNLKLPGHQEEVLKACVESGKPVVLVLLGGSALAVNYADEHANAILEAWYPGARGGEAVARALFGETNPQGKLPVTFYHSDRDLPEFTDYAMKGRTYRYMEKEALYPFGYGLSYTKFGFKDAALSANEAGADGLDVTVSVTNEGAVAGRESVEVYVKAERENTPNAQLKGLVKVDLQPGETKQVKIHLPLAAFALCDAEGTPIVEAGSYSVYVGASQPDARSVALMGQAPAKLTVTQSATQALDL